jgi:hypothetical protein
MTIDQLIERLQIIKNSKKGAGKMEVCIQELQSEFTYGEVEKVLIKKIDFKEEPGGKTLSSYDCVVLTDEI